MIPPLPLTSLSVTERNKLFYAKASASGRFINVYRPYICPVDPIIEAVPEGSRVLDIGCGCGMMLLNLAASGNLESGLGVEISRSAVEDACSASEILAEHLGKNLLHFECRQPEAVLDHQMTFDVVMLIDVMHHVPPTLQDDFLEGVMKLVRPGGRLIYKDMCSKPAWKAFGNRLHDLVLARQWINYYPIQRVSTAASRNGWRPLEEKEFSRFWYGHEMLVFERPFN